MGLFTLQATVNTTPNPAHPSDLAVTSATNTGHANSTAADTGAPVQQNKSCVWSGFPAAGGQISKVTLKFDWDIPTGGGTTDITGGGSAAADASFIVTVSTDGGSTFPTTALTRSFSISGNDSASLIESGSVSLDLTLPVSTDQIQVADRLHANATEGGGGDADASVQANISNIKIEVATYDAGVIALW